MSWDSYVGSMEGEGCCYVGFFDHEGNKWAESKSPEINPTSTQVKKIVDGIRPPRSVNLMAGGITLGDKNLLCVAITDHTAVFKQKGDDASDKVMVCVGCFNQGTVVGVSHAGEREKASRIAVEKYVDYLRSINY